MKLPSRIVCSARGHATRAPPHPAGARPPAYHPPLFLCGAQIANMDAKDSVKRQKMDAIKQHLRGKRVPNFLREPILEFYERLLMQAQSMGGTPPHPPARDWSRRPVMRCALSGPARRLWTPTEHWAQGAGGLPGARMRTTR